MRPSTRLLISLLFLSLAQGQPSEELAAARATLAPLARQLQMLDDSDYARYSSRRDSLTAEVFRDLDQYFVRQRLAQAATNARASLDVLLGAFGDNTEVSNTPFVWSGELRQGNALVTAYLLLRQAGNDSVCTIRAYREADGGSVLTATAGSDMDGYGLMLREVVSPVPGELWLMAWGNRFMFNGRLVRYRLYSFDGENFRTLWSPEDRLDGDLEWISEGFVIVSSNPSARLGETRGPAKLREEFALYPSGPVLARSSYDGQAR